MVYFRELPAPIQDLDPVFIDVFYDFANAFSEEAIRYAEMKHRKKRETEPASDIFRNLGYGEKDIAEMDIEQ